MSRQKERAGTHHDAGPLEHTHQAASVGARDEARYLAAWRVLIELGYRLFRGRSTEGLLIFVVARGGHTRVLHDLDELAGFVRDAVTSEVRP